MIAFVSTSFLQKDQAENAKAILKSFQPSVVIHSQRGQYADLSILSDPEISIASNPGLKKITYFCLTELKQKGISPFVLCSKRGILRNLNLYQKTVRIELTSQSERNSISRSVMEMGGTVANGAEADYVIGSIDSQIDGAINKSWIDALRESHFFVDPHPFEIKSKAKCPSTPPSRSLKLTSSPGSMPPTPSGDSSVKSNCCLNLVPCSPIQTKILSKPKAPAIPSEANEMSQELGSQILCQKTSISSDILSDLESISPLSKSSKWRKENLTSPSPLLDFSQNHIEEEHGCGIGYEMSQGISSLLSQCSQSQRSQCMK